MGGQAIKVGGDDQDVVAQHLRLIQAALLEVGAFWKPS